MLPLSHSVGERKRSESFVPLSHAVGEGVGEREKVSVMYKTLSAGAIGVHVGDLQGGLEAAKTGGFEGLEFNPEEIANLIDSYDLDHVKKLFIDAGIRPAGFGLPVNWRQSEEHWKEGLEKLPRQAQAARQIGGIRAFTWLMPCSNERAFDANYRFHIQRFKPIAQILADYGCSLGLEFIGPKTLRDSQAYPFVHTMLAMVDLGKAIGPNVGLLLDCWHWYTSHGTLDDLRELTPDRVTYVHVNDAPHGKAVDEQIDSVRALPGETGVIDITGFLQVLRHIGYDGPVTPEPFKKELAELASDEVRLKTVGAAMTAIFQHAGLE